MMNGFMAPEKEKTLEERRKEEEAKIKEEEEKKIQEAERMKHNYVIRMADSKSKLETDDLDDEEMKILKEVSSKGYYHARPQTQASSAPQKLESAEALEWKKVSFNRSTHKRSMFAKKDESRETSGNDAPSKVQAAAVQSESKPQEVASSTPSPPRTTETNEVPPASKVHAEASQPLRSEIEKTTPWFLQCCKRRDKSQ
eukprot:TRINITY_DN48680_c0_g1_i1.p1 TRINITY_DN48680_c0_g1~~TRINITY_DN48680_c0_g1_i1.p1  ORF type:complete len:199 (+),score=54.64 TRINITY_DN48680_c0_g1_i1:51-647(+)